MNSQPELTALRITTIRVPISRGVKDIMIYRKARLSRVTIHCDIRETEKHDYYLLLCVTIHYWTKC
jgi:hypothetical protein